MKSHFKKFILLIANNVPILMACYFTSLISASLIFYYLEPVSLLDAFYWSCTTALSVGYGDVLPTHTITKIIYLFFSHFWLMLMIPCIATNIIVMVFDDKDEFTHDEQEYLKQKIVENNKVLNEVLEKLDQLTKDK